VNVFKRLSHEQHLSWCIETSKMSLPPGLCLLLLNLGEYQTEVIVFEYCLCVHVKTCSSG